MRRVWGRGRWPAPSAVFVVWSLRSCWYSSVQRALSASRLRNCETTRSKKRSSIPRISRACCLDEFARSIQAVDLVLSDVKTRIQELDFANSDEMRRMLATRNFHDLLRERLARLPQARNIAVTDEIWPDSSYRRRVGPLPKINVSDRDYFQELPCGVRRTLEHLVAVRKPNQWRAYDRVRATPYCQSWQFRRHGLRRNEYRLHPIGI